MCAGANESVSSLEKERILMASGFDLKKGKYDQSVKTSKEIKYVFSKFFEKNSKKESTYKYAMFKAIIDCMNVASDKTYKISFDALFCRFSEIYWVLVFKHRIPQMAPSIKSSETLAERVIQDIASEHKIKRKTSYFELSNYVRYEMMNQMKKKCSKYVFGALYAETDQIFYSFSKEGEWIKLNPRIVDYINKHMTSIQALNYLAWSKYYADIIIAGKEAMFYQRLLKREFGENRVLLCVNPAVIDKKVVQQKKVCKEKNDSFDLGVAEKVRGILRQYPDIGIYVTQVCEKVGADREQVRQILDNSFWSRKEGNRYYYLNITNEDIVNDTLFQEDVEGETDNQSIDLGEIDEKYMNLLDNPELLIKILKAEKIPKREERIQKKSQNNNSNKQYAAISTKSMQKKWEREEVVILVVEYFRSKNLSAAKIFESQQKVSEFLRRREEIRTGCSVDDTFRNLAGVRMQSGRIRCLDPDTKYAGMQGTKLQKEIVNEYLAHPRRMLAEANKIYDKYQ